MVDKNLSDDFFVMSDTFGFCRVIIASTSREGEMMMLKKKDVTTANGSEIENRVGGEEMNSENEKRDEAVADKDRAVKQWVRDAEQLKILVPEFDLEEAVKQPAFAEALLSGKTVIEAYKELIGLPRNEPREEIAQNARNARRGTGGATQNPAKLSDEDFKKYINNIKNG